MLCLSGFELYSRWVPLTYERKAFPPYDIVKNGKRCFEIWSKII